MSTIVEAVVCPKTAESSNAAAAISSFHVVSKANVLVLIRRGARTDPFDPALLATVAMTLSKLAGTAVAVEYDGRVAYGAASLFRNGTHLRSFGEPDELWVPLAEDGNPILNETPLSHAQLIPGEEYETIHNAIDLALGEAGYLTAATFHDIVQMAYEA